MRPLALTVLGYMMLSLWCAEAEPVSFRKEIAPLLQRRCATCHNEESSKGHYRLDTFAKLAKPGDSDLPPLVPGKPEDSELYRLLLEPGADDRMPQKADPLPEEEIALIGRWISEGARQDADSPEQPLVELARETLLRPAPETYVRPLPVTALAFSPDGKHLATSGYYEVLMWNVEDGSLLRRIGGMPQKINALCWSGISGVLAVVGGSPGQWGTAVLINPREHFATRILGDFQETALAAAFNPDGTTLAVGGGDRTIRFFDVQSGKQTRLFRHHADWVQSVSFSRDGMRLLSSSRDRTARVLNVATGEVDATFTEHQAAVLSAVFLDNSGSRALSIDRSKNAQEWDAASGTKKKTTWNLDGEQLLVSGGLLITSGGSLVTTIDQLADGQRLFTLRGQRDAVQSVATAPSGMMLATGSADGEVLIWSLACGTWTQRFRAVPHLPPSTEPAITAVTR